MKKLIDAIFSRIRQLRWKLTLSYTLVTVAALLILEIVLMVVMMINVAKESTIKPESVFNDLETDYSALASAYLSETPPDKGGLRKLLGQYNSSSMDSYPIRVGNLLFGASSTNILSVIFLAPDGTVIDTLPHDLLENTRAGEEFEVSEIPGLEGPLRAAFTGVTNYDYLYAYGEKNRIVGAVPIFSAKYDILPEDVVAPILNETGPVVGAIAFIQKTGFWEVWTFSQIVQQVWVSLLFILLFAAILGAIIGSITARGLVGRLKKLFDSAHSWSQGDFSVLVDDSSGDELGRLAKGLNAMAGQLANLLVERQQLSVMEERNRLARDLHDSVKQQAFAASAQLGAARTRFRSNPVQAEVHMVESEKLMYEVRLELTDLIQELRPIALQGRGLATAVREYVLDCSNQTDIEIDVRIHGERALPLEVEQALFRIVQGALANVARHSQADHAEVLMIYGPDTITLNIADNGRGFCVNSKHNGFGLPSMYERAELINGDLSIESEIGKGTRVTVKCAC
jgi:signal transduction histidine kinase